MQREAICVHEVETDASCGCERRGGPSLLTQLHQLADLESQLGREEKALEEITKEVEEVTGGARIGKEQ